MKMKANIQRKAWFTLQARLHKRNSSQCFQYTLISVDLAHVDHTVDAKLQREQNHNQHPA